MFCFYLCPSPQGSRHALVGRMNHLTLTDVSQTVMASEEICHWPGCCCRHGRCPAPCPCPCFHVCACACACVCASFSSSCAHGGDGDGGGHARYCVSRMKTGSLWRKMAQAWQAWREATVPRMVALYLKTEKTKAISLPRYGIIKIVDYVCTYLV